MSYHGPLHTIRIRQFFAARKEGSPLPVGNAFQDWYHVDPDFDAVEMRRDFMRLTRRGFSQYISFGQEA
jgi:hypothetical protein